MDVCEVMQKAIQIEEEAEQFYRDAAEETSNPLAEHTFVALADWEVEHKKLLQSVYDAAQANNSCPALTELDAEQVNMVEEAGRLFSQALEDLRGDLATDPTLDAAYATAMEKERRSIRFYQERLDESSTDEERDLFGFLVGQERGHLNLLATTEEYLNDTTYWNFKQEMWIVTG